MKKKEDQLKCYVSINLLIKYGFNVYDICEYINISFGTVRNYIKKYNIKLNYSFYHTDKKVGRTKGSKWTKIDKEARKHLNFSGEKNPFYGKKHSLETKIQMSKNHADFSGEKNPFKNKYINDEEFRKHIKESHIKKWEKRDKKWRKDFGEKISESLANSEKLKNRNLHKYHKCGHLTHRKCGKIFYRSSWELNAAHQLIQNDIVKEFKLEPFYIEYINIKGDNRFSRIDFFITLTNNKQIIMEVKPKSLQEYKNNKNKIEAYKKYCGENNMNFILFDEDYLNTDTLKMELLKCL